MTAPPIHTARLLLRPFSLEDAADVFAYASNANVSRHVTWQAHRTIEDSQAFVDMVLARGSEETTWAITCFGEPTVIGAIEWSMKGDTEAEFHYVLAEPYWNRGLMTEAARAVLAWGLKTFPGVRRVSTRAVMENVGSRRVMEKCGLTFAGTRMFTWKKQGGQVEQCEYILERDPST